MSTERQTKGRTRRRAGAAGALLLALATLAGCGGDDSGGTIPQSQANGLLAQLEAVREATDQGDCVTAGRAADEFVNGIDTLPADVGVETKEALRAAGENLVLLTQDPEQCDPTGTTGLTGTQPTTPTTTTTATETTTQETTTEDEEPPPGHDDDGDGNSGRGNGNGSGGTGGTGGGE